MSGPVAVHRLEDPFAFAQAAGTHSGQAAIAAMPRLQDRLSDKAGHVSFVVRGGQDQRQRLLFELEIAGNLSLRCDRCLEPLAFPLQLHATVLLAQPGAVLPVDDDPESPEWIEAGPELDLLELVEDEIVLGLPLSVRHDQGKCGSGAGISQADGREKPFSGLAALLDPQQTNTD
ncbi:MAG: YceD family protein [Burkholderiales bacterium]|nr:YceD family protein [Burkholderiales bacterium]